MREQEVPLTLNSSASSDAVAASNIRGNEAMGVRMSQHIFSNRPLYLQVRDAVADRIATGAWKPGVSIPNEGELAREFGVSPGTMRKALDIVEAERLVTRRQGRGTFVNDQTSEALAVRFSNIHGADGKPIAPEINAGKITEGPANDQERERLQLQPIDTVYRIHRIHSHKNQRYMVEQASMPATLFPGLCEMKGDVSRIMILAAQHGMLLGRAQERISVGEASAKAALVLGIAPGAPILALDRVMRALDGCLVEWRTGQCLPAHHYLAEIT